MENNRIIGREDEQKTLRMITTFGVKRNAYSNIVQSQVLLDDLFVFNI